MYSHISVMTKEVLNALDVRPGGLYCDATIGGGGHAQAILEQSSPDGKLIGIDQDEDAILWCQKKLESFGSRVILHKENFSKLDKVFADFNYGPLDGIVLDLGISSRQLDNPTRGFSFNAKGPIDMRMDPLQKNTAYDLIASCCERELANIIRDFGEEPRSLKIAASIIKAHRSGNLKNTEDLANAVCSVIPWQKRKKIHPATRTFMALRIAVNNEIAAINQFLGKFVDFLKPEGRIAVISFHSLEDRAVKQCFTQLADPCTCPPDLPVCGCKKQANLRLIARHPIMASEQEVKENPRARSAKMRVAKRL